jgi:hypothetical protein
MSQPVPTHRRVAVRGVALFASLALAACGGSSTDSSSSGGAALMTVVEVSNGFGVLLPHTTFRVDPNTDLVTNEVIALRTVDDYHDNVRSDNPVLPSTIWDDQALLPNGSPGNHFVVARFSQELDEDSVFDLTPAGVATNFLSGAVQVVAFDPLTGLSTNVTGRAFLGGRTPSQSVQVSGFHDLETWVTEDGADAGTALDAAVFTGLGFPGTQDVFAGMENLIEPGVFVFVADTDGDLTTHETFPTARQIRVEFTTGLRSTDGEFLESDAVASSTVGADLLPPRVATKQVGIDVVPEIDPGNGMEDVDPSTTILVRFTEPVQPAELGVFDEPEADFEYDSAFEMTFGPQETLTSVQHKVRILSAYDLTRFEFVPAYPFPGTGPEARACDEYSRVDVSLSSGALSDLSLNVMTDPASSFFVAGSGRVITNAPVLPDAIYLSRINPVGISVIDLNGFGGGTGDPTFDAANPWKTGNTRFPLNPNVGNGGALVPQLQPGTCTFNGGSAGAMTLTRNSALDTRLVRSPHIESIADMMVGYSLDSLFNNAPPPLGCQSGNPNACAASGLKQPNGIVVGSTLAPAQPGQFSTIPPGSPNPISWAPSPNPPPLAFPPLCISPSIEAQEPTSIDVLLVPLGGTAGVPPGVPKQPNQLAPNGNPLGNPSLGIPPNGLFIGEQNCYFVGPSAPVPDPASCLSHMMRQQVGHFLYVADRLRSEVVVFNSNRMTVIDRIKVADPTNFAMSPNLDILAVTNRVANQVTFIDILPTSTTFNKVLKITTLTGTQPTAIVWQPDNEDILVCNQGDNSLSLISAFSLEERKKVGGLPGTPIDICVGPRHRPPTPQLGLGRDTYFGYILSANGLVTIYESGPDGVGGWGPDSLIGSATQVFKSPKRMVLDRSYLSGALWIAHSDPFDIASQTASGVGGGAISQLRVTSAVGGIIPVTAIVNLTSRQLDLDVFVSLGESTLSGAPVDISFDNMLNIAGGLPNPTTNYSAAGNPAPINGKNTVRVTPAGWVPASSPTFMFVSVPNKSAVDVIRLQGGFQRLDVDVTTPGTQSIVADGATLLVDYWRQ